MRFFESKEVKVSPSIAGDYQLAAVGENAQQYAALSQVKVASTTPVSKSATFSIRSQEAETAGCPSGVAATPLTCF